MIEKIKIGTWNINVELISELKDENNNEALGLAKSWLRKIELNAKYSNEIRINTLFHECLHLIAEYNGIDLNENQIESFSNNLIEFITNNQQLIFELI